MLETPLLAGSAIFEGEQDNYGGNAIEQFKCPPFDISVRQLLEYERRSVSFRTTVSASDITLHALELPQLVFRSTIQRMGE